MSLTGSTTSEKIWNYLYADIKNAFGVSGLMANFYAESGLKSTNLQNSYEKTLGYTDTTYTEAVDNGTYKNFSTDGAGYGLVQWTYKTRKANMYDYIVTKRGKSIGDLESQLAFCLYELKNSYSAVYKVLCNATSVSEASNKVLVSYENPANQSESVKNTRTNYGIQYYNKYASTSTSTSSTTNSNAYSAGAKVTLKAAGLYSSSTSTTSANTITGTYYLWDGTVINGRIRITTKTSYVGISGKVTGWIATSAINSTISSTSNTSSAITLKKAKLYATSTTKTVANTISGVYYRWDNTSANNRCRITNKKSNIGKTGQVTGWISLEDIS